MRLVARRPTPAMRTRWRGTSVTERADTLFTGGTVFTSGWERSKHQDVAVRAGEIVAVGEPGSLDELRHSATEVVDLTSRMLLPGFQDSHVHPVQAGVELLQCDLTRASDAEDCLRIIGEYAASHPDEPWILGAGWSMEFFLGGTPTREALDRVVPDRPVALSNRDHHGIWVNTRALELAGITDRTPDPTDGRIERDAGGAASGTLHEGAVGLLAHVKPAIDHGLATVQAGAQGEHKLARGYEPVITRSAHFLPDPGFRRAVSDFVEHEREAIAMELAWARDALPYK